MELDTIIYCGSAIMCCDITKYFGFMFVDDILKEVKINTKIENVLLLRIRDKKSKLYSLLQTYINQRLMFGINNVCLTSDENLFKNLSAHVKAIIRDNLNEDLLVSIQSHSFIMMRVQNTGNIKLEYTSAIAEIMDAVLKSQTYIDMLYILCV